MNINLVNRITIHTIHKKPTFDAASIKHVIGYIKIAHAFQSRLTLNVLLFLDTCISILKRPRKIVYL